MTKTKTTRTILGACAFAGMLVPLLPGAASAQGAPTPAQLMRMIEAQQKQLDALKGELGKAQAEAQAATAQAAKAEAASPGFLKTVEIGGTIEVEATNSSDFADADSSDLTLAKVEAYLDTRPTDYLSTHIQFLYEDDGNEKHHPGRGLRDPGRSGNDSRSIFRPVSGRSRSAGSIPP